MANGEMLTIDDWVNLKVIRDGDSYFVARPDFVDLQTSPVVFIEPHTREWDIIKEWHMVSFYPLAHIELWKVVEIIAKLNGKGQEG